MVVAFILSEGNIHPCVVRAGQVVRVDALTGERPDRYEISKMTRDELLEVAHAGVVHVRGTMKKADLVDCIYNDWELMRQRIRMRYGNEQAQARGSDDASDDSASEDATRNPEDDSDDGTAPSEFDIGSSVGGDDAASEHSLDDIFNTIGDEICDPKGITLDDLDQQEIPREYLNDPSCFALPKVISVVVNQLSGKRLFVPNGISEKSTTDGLKEAIVAEIVKRVAELPPSARAKAQGMVLGADNFNLLCGLVKMDASTALASYVSDERDTRLDVVLELKIRGGAPFGVRRPFLKKEQALAQLKKKLDKNYKPDAEMDFGDAQLTPSFVAFVKEIDDKFAEFLSLKNRCGSSFLSMGLKQVSDADLTALEALFSPRRGVGKNLTVEEKCVKALEMLYPTLGLLERCSKKMEHTHQDIMLSLLWSCLPTSFINIKKMWGRFLLTVQPSITKLSTNLDVVGTNLDSLKWMQMQWRLTVFCSDCFRKEAPFDRLLLRRHQKPYRTAWQKGKTAFLACFWSVPWCGALCPLMWGALSPDVGRIVPRCGAHCLVIWIPFRDRLMPRPTRFGNPVVFRVWLLVRYSTSFQENDLAKQPTELDIWTFFQSESETQPYHSNFEFGYLSFFGEGGGIYCIV